MTNDNDKYKMLYKIKQCTEFAVKNGKKKSENIVGEGKREQLFSSCITFMHEITYAPFHHTTLKIYVQ